MQQGIGAKTNVGYGQLQDPNMGIVEEASEQKTKLIEAEIIDINIHKAHVICQLMDGTKKTIQFENTLQLQMKGYKKGQKIILVPNKKNPKEFEIKE